MLEKPVLQLPQTVTPGSRSADCYDDPLLPAPRLSLISQLINGTVSGVDYLFAQQGRLASGWGQASGRPWFQVSSSLFHEPLREAMRELRRLDESGVLHYAHAKQFLELKSWLQMFSLLLEGFSQVKTMISEARVKHGFVTYVNPDFYSLLRQVDVADSLLDKLLGRYCDEQSGQEAEDDEGKRRRKSASSLKSALLSQGRTVILRDELILQLYSALRKLIAECDNAMQAEEAFLWPLLANKYSEGAELHCILEAFSCLDCGSAAEGFALSVVVGDMRLWCTEEEKLNFIRCLPFIQRVVLISRWSNRKFHGIFSTADRRSRGGSQSLSAFPSWDSFDESSPLKDVSSKGRRRYSCPSQLESGLIADTKSRGYLETLDCFLETPTDLSTNFCIAETPAAMIDS